MRLTVSTDEARTILSLKHGVSTEDIVIAIPPDEREALIEQLVVKGFIADPLEDLLSTLAVIDSVSAVMDCLDDFKKSQATQVIKDNDPFVNAFNACLNSPASNYSRNGKFYQTICDYIKADTKLEAIKYVREVLGSGLIPAKDLVDAIHNGIR